MNKIRILVGSHAGEIITTGQINNSSAGQQCLLCGTNGGRDRRVVSNDCFGKLALKMLMRYLKIDVSKVLSNSVGGADRREERVSSHQKDEVKLEEVARTFCDGCDANVVKFWEVYQEFEAVRLLLEQSLHQIMEHLKSCRTKVTDGTLSGDVLRKCTLRLGSTPRVRVEEIGNCYKNTIVATSEASNKISARGANEDGGEQDESVPIIKQEESDLGSTNNSDEDYDDNYRPASPEGSLRAPSSSKPSDSDSEKSIGIGSHSKIVNAPTAGTTKTKISVQKASECVHDESVSVAKDEVSYADSDYTDDGDYLPASPDSSLSGASSTSSSESGSGTSETTMTGRKKPVLPSPSTSPLTSYQKLKKLQLAKRRKRVQPCRICGNKFPTIIALQLHMRLHTKAETCKSIKCSYCPQVSKDTLEHQQHTLCSHPIEFMGSDLPAGTTKQKLNLVLEQMLNQCDRVLVNDAMDSESFRCSICHSVLTNVFDWRAHVMETHISDIVTTLQNQQRESETFGTEQEARSRGAGINVCLHCGKGSKNRMCHLKHVQQVHPFEFYPIPEGVNINERNFMKCLSKASEQIVKTVVSEKNNWQCPFCPTSFSERTSCRKHMCRNHLASILSGVDASPKRKSHNPNQTRKNNLSKKKCAKCVYCGKEFGYATQCRSHCVKYHCYEYLSDQVGQLPSHVTEINLEWAIETMMEESRSATSENTLDYQCPLCKKGSKLYRIWRFRDHLFSDEHLDEVLPLLLERIEHSAHTTTLNLRDLDHDTSNTATTSAMIIVADVDPANPVTCVYCGTVTGDKDRHREHLRTNHSYHYYIKQLPNISEKDFNRTLNAMISESKLKHATSTGMGYKCNFCKVMKSGKLGMKIHLLTKPHFPELLSRLESKNSDTPIGASASGDSESDSARSTATVVSAAKVAKSSSVIRAKRNPNPKTSQCRICRKVFLNSKTLLLHMSCHTSTLASQACTYCSQSFKDALEHQQHVFCNHAELFFAEELPKGTTKEKLESVLERLLGVCERVVENNSESVKCSICKTNTGNPLEWRVHMWEAHLPLLVEVLENKVEISKASMGLDSLWRCKFCGKISATSTRHRIHLKTVHIFKAYSHKFPPGANVSEQAFTQSLVNACTLVVKVVVNKKTCFQCPFCPMVFCRRPPCKVHMLEQHLPNLISAATETTAMKPNGDQSHRHKLRPSKNRKKKGKELLCMYSPCGKVFARYEARWIHSICQHPYQQLTRSKKLPRGTREEDLLITIERMLQEAKLPSSQNRDRQSQYKCTMCKPARVFGSVFRAHLLSPRYHLHEVLARLPPPPQTSNNNSNSATIKEATIVPNPIPREVVKKENDDLPNLNDEDDIDSEDDDDEEDEMMDVPSSDPLMTADNIKHGDNGHDVAEEEDEDMELE